MLGSGQPDRLEWEVAKSVVAPDPQGACTAPTRTSCPVLTPGEGQPGAQGRWAQSTRGEAGWPDVLSFYGDVLGGGSELEGEEEGRKERRGNGREGKTKKLLLLSLLTFASASES